MNYQIYNNTASIGFHSAIGDVLLMKRAVNEITIIRGDIIKISTNNCHSSIFFRHKDVSVPTTATPMALVELMNGWLASFTPPPGGGE